MTGTILSGSVNVNDVGHHVVQKLVYKDIVSVKFYFLINYFVLCK